IEDEDGDPCEDLPTLTAWVRKKINEVCASSAYHLIGLNFSTYGASFVNVGDNGEPATPLYNYLKDFPADLQEAFFASYPEETNNQETASPLWACLIRDYSCIGLKSVNRSYLPGSIGLCTCRNTCPLYLQANM